jgi:hypothetical protein
MTEEQTRINNTVNLPKIVRVRNHTEAKQEARLHGLNNCDWRYIERPDQIMGVRFLNGKTYYIHHDVPYWAIQSRFQ